MLGDDVGAVAEEIDQGSCVDFLGEVAQGGVAGALGVNAEDFEPAGESVRVQVPARTGAREQPRRAGVDGVLVPGVLQVLPEHLGERFGNGCRGGPEGEKHAVRCGREVFPAEQDDLVQGMGPQQQDQPGQAGGTGDLAVFEAVPEELEAL